MNPTTATHAASRQSKKAAPTPRKEGQPAKGKRGRKPPPPGETDRDRFLRIGNARMINALKAIELMENLSRGAYEWSLADVDAMERKLIEQAQRTANEFRRVHAEKLARAQKQEAKKAKPDFSFAETSSGASASNAAARSKPTFS